MQEGGSSSVTKVDQCNRVPQQQVSDLDNTVLCGLCQGYLIEATTITDCLHSYCRSCLMKYLTSHKTCPRCHIIVYRDPPKLNVRDDKLLQEVLYSLVPGLFENEMQKRLQFAKLKHKCENGKVISAMPGFSCREKQKDLDQHHSGTSQGECSHDDHISIILQLCHKKPIYSEQIDDCGDRRYLLCPGAVSVKLLKKFIMCKFQLPSYYQVEFYYAGNKMPDTYTLSDIILVFGWTKVKPLTISYTVLDPLASILNQKRARHLQTQSASKHSQTTKHVKKSKKAANSRKISGILTNTSKAVCRTKKFSVISKTTPSAETIDLSHSCSANSLNAENSNGYDHLNSDAVTDIDSSICSSTNQTPEKGSTDSEEYVITRFTALNASSPEATLSPGGGSVQKKAPKIVIQRKRRRAFNSESDLLDIGEVKVQSEKICEKSPAVKRRSLDSLTERDRSSNNLVHTPQKFVRVLPEPVLTTTLQSRNTIVPVIDRQGFLPGQTLQANQNKSDRIAENIDSVTVIPHCLDNKDNKEKDQQNGNTGSERIRLLDTKVTTLSNDLDPKKQSFEDYTGIHEQKKIGHAKRKLYLGNSTENADIAINLVSEDESANESMNMLEELCGKLLNKPHEEMDSSSCCEQSVSEDDNNYIEGDTLVLNRQSFTQWTKINSVCPQTKHKISDISNKGKQCVGAHNDTTSRSVDGIESHYISKSDVNYSSSNDDGNGDEDDRLITDKQANALSSSNSSILTKKNKLIKDIPILQETNDSEKEVIRRDSQCLLTSRSDSFESTESSKSISDTSICSNNSDVHNSAIYTISTTKSLNSVLSEHDVSSQGNETDSPPHARIKKTLLTEQPQGQSNLKVVFSLIPKPLKLSKIPVKVFNDSVKLDQSSSIIDVPASSIRNELNRKTPEYTKTSVLVETPKGVACTGELKRAKLFLTDNAHQKPHELHNNSIQDVVDTVNLKTNTQGSSKQVTDAVSDYVKSPDKCDALLDFKSVNQDLIDSDEMQHNHSSVENVKHNIICTPDVINPESKLSGITMNDKILVPESVEIKLKTADKKYVDLGSDNLNCDIKKTNVLSESVILTSPSQIALSQSNDMDIVANSPNFMKSPLVLMTGNGSCMDVSKAPCETSLEGSSTGVQIIPAIDIIDKGNTVLLDEQNIDCKATSKEWNLTTNIEESCSRTTIYIPARNKEPKRLLPEMSPFVTTSNVVSSTPKQKYVDRVHLITNSISRSKQGTNGQNEENSRLIRHNVKPACSSDLKEFAHVKLVQHGDKQKDKNKDSCIKKDNNVKIVDISGMDKDESVKHISSSGLRCDGNMKYNVNNQGLKKESFVQLLPASVMKKDYSMKHVSNSGVNDVKIFHKTSTQTVPSPNSSSFSKNRANIDKIKIKNEPVKLVQVFKDIKKESSYVNVPAKHQVKAEVIKSEDLVKINKPRPLYVADMNRAERRKIIEQPSSPFIRGTTVSDSDRDMSHNSSSAFYSPNPYYYLTPPLTLTPMMHHPHHQAVHPLLPSLTGIERSPDDLYFLRSPMFDRSHALDFYAGGYSTPTGAGNRPPGVYPLSTGVLLPSEIPIDFSHRTIRGGSGSNILRENHHVVVRQNNNKNTQMSRHVAESKPK